MAGPSIVIRQMRNVASDRQNRRRLRVLVFVAAVGMVITQVFPTLAENAEETLIPWEETATAITPIENPEVDAEVSPANDVEVMEPGEEGQVESSEGAEAEISDSDVDFSPPLPPPPPPFATSSQNIFITMPTSVRVDPRATTTLLPRMLFFSINTLLVCISSNSLKFDIGVQGVIDDSLGDYLMISGDRTNFLMVSGNSAWVNGYLNSDAGMRVFSELGGIGKNSALFRFVDISEPSINAELCLDGNTDNYRSIQVTPLGISLSTSKGSVGLKKGGK